DPAEEVSILRRLSFFLWLFLVVAATPLYAEQTTLQVVGVDDGSTLEVNLSLPGVSSPVPMPFHLYGIYAPAPNQKFGDAAVAALKQLALGKSITVYTLFDAPRTFDSASSLTSGA